MLLTITRVVRAELSRVAHKPFFYAIPILALVIVISSELNAYHYALSVHSGSINLLPGVPNPFRGADLSQLLYSFHPEILIPAACATFLLNWGICLVGYAGAAWVADDLTTGVIAQIALLRRRVVPVLVGRFLSLCLYIAAIFCAVAIGSVVVSVFLDEVPHSEVSSLLGWLQVRSLVLFVIMAVMWASLIAMITLLSRSPIFSAAFGIVWPVAETVLLIFGNAPWQLFLAKVAPISTIRSLVAFLYDRFSWVPHSPPVILWVSSPPLTRSLEGGVLRPYLLPFSFLLGVLALYLLLAFTGIMVGYYVRTRD